MSTELLLDYHYGIQGEQYTFYRVPKSLFTSKVYAKLTEEKKLCNDAKILYGLMLDRMALSQKNSWIDTENRVYIIFTLAHAQEFLGCGHSKAVKLFTELKNVGLIRQQKQGMGRPARIYVMNFISAIDEEVDTPPAPETPFEDSEPETPLARLPKSRSHDFSKTEVKTSDNQTSRLPKNGSLDFRKTDTNKNDINNTENSDTDSIILSIAPAVEEMEEMDFDRAWFLERIEYDYLRDEHERRGDRERLDELVDLLLDALQSRKATLWVNGERRPTKAVQGQLMKLGPEHIVYVLDCMAANTTRVKNMRSYLLTALYNAPMTMDHSVANQVQHDFGPHGRFAEEGLP